MKSVFLLQTLFTLFTLLGSMDPADKAAKAAEEESQADSATFLLGFEPAAIVNGSPCIFRVKSAKPLRSLSGTWLDRRIYFDFDVASGTWYGFAGVEFDTAPGQHTLALEAVLAGGNRISSGFAVAVGKAAYRTVALSVPGKYTEPSAETLERIKQEQALKKTVFNRSNKERFWSGSFALPVNSVITGNYGVERTFNGVRQSVHYGTDFRAETGTPLAAINNGEIILARELFYEGGFIVIDHGQGLLSLYMHLSEIKRSEGEFIKKGEIIGLSGDTGRATGPHLHIGVRWQGVYLNPAVLLKLRLP